MSLRQTIHLHCVLDPDAPPLAPFLARYDDWVDRYHFWDAGANSARLAEVHSHRGSEVRPVPTGPGSSTGTPQTRAPDDTHGAPGSPGRDARPWSPEALRDWLDQCWKQSRSQADWVLLVRPDEHLHHPDLRTYLASCTRQGITALRALGYELLLPSALRADAYLHTQVTQGVRDARLDRLCVLDPNAIAETRYSVDLAHAWPEGHVVQPDSAQVLLLRFAADADRALHLREAATVPGLGARADESPERWRGDEQTVDESGLFDTDWYLARYPDVRAGGIDALVHFCQYGWREGRQPNPYFDTSWFAMTYADELASGQNPLVHYIRRAEAENAWPSPHFDPEWYRDTHGLPISESPLRHYLLRRLEGRGSPLPGFDPALYLRDHPALAGQQADWYLHSLTESLQAQAPAAPARPPTWPELVELAGGQFNAGILPAQVPWNSYVTAVKRLVELAPFDADWYLANNPDVAQAVQAGALDSAHRHFVDHGYFEGRSPRAPATPR